MEKILIPVAAVCIYSWWHTTPPLMPGKKSLTFYYSSSCPHCRNMYPELRHLGCKYKGVYIRWIEEGRNNEYRVQKFPTLIYRDGHGNIDEYTGTRTATAIAHYLERK